MGKYSFRDFIKAEISVHVKPDDLERFARECDKYGARYLHDETASDSLACMKRNGCERFSIDKRTTGWIEFDSWTHELPMVEFRDMEDVFPSMKYSFNDFLSGKINLRFRDAAEYADFQKKCDENKVYWFKWSGTGRIEKMTAHGCDAFPKCYRCANRGDWYEVVLVGLYPDAVNLHDLTDWQLAKPDAWAEFVAGKCYLRIEKADFDAFADKCEQAGMKWAWSRDAHRREVHGVDNLARLHLATGAIGFGRIGSMARPDFHIYGFSTIRPAPVQAVQGATMKPEQPKYKVGDLFRVIADRPNNTNLIRGDIVEVVKIASENNAVIKSRRTGDVWYMWLKDMEPYTAEPEQKIVITHDNKTTYAKLYEDGKVIKEGKAVCSPDDTFDFQEGALLAFDRLLNVQNVKTLTASEMRGWASDLEKLSQTIFKAAQ